MIVSSINSYPNNTKISDITFGAKNPKGFRRGLDQVLKTTGLPDSYEKAVKKVVSSTIEPIRKKLGVTPRKTFDDIGGNDEIINILTQDVVLPIKYPKAFPAGMQERAIILYGDEGCGKTTIAEAVAKEAGAYFIKIDGIELTPDWLKNYEDNLNKIFEEAKEHQPAIIFLDNIDKFSDKTVKAYTQKPQITVISDTSKKSEDEFSIEEENFIANFIHHKINELEASGDKVIVLGASKNSEILSSPLVTTRRMSVLDIQDPNPNELIEIFKIHSKNMKINPEVEVENLMAFICAYSGNGSDVVSMLKEATKQAYARCGIYDKMLNGTFKQSDLKKVELNFKDFENALNIDFCPRIITTEEAPVEKHIGFRMSSDHTNGTPKNDLQDATAVLESE